MQSNLSINGISTMYINIMELSMIANNIIMELSNDRYNNYALAATVVTTTSKRGNVQVRYHMCKL